MLLGIRVVVFVPTYSHIELDAVRPGKVAPSSREDELFLLQIGCQGDRLRGVVPPRCRPSEILKEPSQNRHGQDRQDIHFILRSWLARDERGAILFPQKW